MNVCTRSRVSSTPTVHLSSRLTRRRTLARHDPNVRAPRRVLEPLQRPEERRQRRVALGRVRRVRRSQRAHLPDVEKRVLQADKMPPRQGRPGRGLGHRSQRRVLRVGDEVLAPGASAVRAHPALPVSRDPLDEQNIRGLALVVHLEEVGQRVGVRAVHDDPDEPYGGAKHRPHGVHGRGGRHPPPDSRQVSLAHRRVVLRQQQVVRAAAAAHPAHVPQHRDQVQSLLPDARAGNVVRVVPVVHRFDSSGCRIRPAPVRVHRRLERDFRGHVLGPGGAVANLAKRGVLLRARVTHHPHRHPVEAVLPSPRLRERRVDGPGEVVDPRPRHRRHQDEEVAADPAASGQGRRLPPREPLHGVALVLATKLLGPRRATPPRDPSPRTPRRRRLRPISRRLLLLEIRRLSRSLARARVPAGPHVRPLAARVRLGLPRPPPLEPAHAGILDEDPPAAVGLGEAREAAIFARRGSRNGRMAP
mmetsp:Transcript_1613/g.7132  ORF Transcript_1613/g.7132 Transcript_1613/m.7132 type:complete len:475 (-) Transcript_1613:2257-3681(-)